MPVLQPIRRYAAQLQASLSNLEPRQRLVIVSIGVSFFLLLVTFIIFGKQIFLLMADLAGDLRQRPFGWTILSLIIVMTSLPPLIGYSTTTTICGYAYGFPIGWFIAAPSALFGAVLAFILSRYAFEKSIKEWLKGNERFKTLGSVIKDGGLPVMCLIRLAPLPWSLSNAWWATLGDSVSFWQYTVATAISMPKLMIHVWVGSRIGDLTDPNKSKDAMQTTVDVVSIVGGMALGIGLGIYLYRQVDRKIKAHQDEESRGGRLDDYEGTAITGHGSGSDDLDEGSAADGTHDAMSPLLKSKRTHPNNAHFRQGDHHESNSGHWDDTSDFGDHGFDVVVEDERPPK